MPYPTHRLFFATLLALPALVQAAVIEIQEPVGDWRSSMQHPVHAAMQAGALPRSPLQAMHAAEPSGTAQVLRVADLVGTSSAIADVPAATADEVVRAGPQGASDQRPELWTLLVLGAGLVAYQLRRQARNRSGMIRLP